MECASEDDPCKILRAWGLIIGDTRIGNGWIRVEVPSDWRVEIRNERVELYDGHRQLRARSRGGFFREDRPFVLQLLCSIQFNSGRFTDNEGRSVLDVTNARGETLHTFRKHISSDAEHAAAVAEVRDWLTEHYPDWESPYAYWDRFPLPDKE